MESTNNLIAKETSENISIHLESLAYLIYKAKVNNHPKPIVFLGAGASSSAGIPLTDKIVEDIKINFKEKPSIKELILSNETNYYKVMQALTADERRDLFYSYITAEKVKINITNIYLAQLLYNGLIDFVLTVNFDDLILRACALFNFLPPVYDISNIKVPTTSNFREKSVIYLHGQHFGQWLLNSNNELGKVEKVVPKVFNEIKNRRTWIVVGYSGNDEILDHINELGSFTNDLYWVNYLNTNPIDKVTSFINNPDSNAHLINGYNSDSFFLSLHAALKAFPELNIQTPPIIYEPFSSLRTTLEKIIDIQDGKEYIDIKERMEITKKHVNSAIEQFEKGNFEKIEDEKEIRIDLLRKQIIDEIANKNYDDNKIDELYREVKKLNNQSINELLAGLYYNWGNIITKIAKDTKDDSYFKSADLKYKTAVELNPNFDVVYYNWANCLQDYATIKKDNIELFESSSEKYQKAAELNPSNSNIFINWGKLLNRQGSINNDNRIWQNSFEKFNNAVKLDSTNIKAYAGWGEALFDYALVKRDEKLFEESISKYEIATSLDSKSAELYNNLGAVIIQFALIKKSENLFKKGIEELKKAIALDSKLAEAYDNWGFSLANLAKLFPEKYTLQESINMFEKSLELGGEYYNLACIYALKNDKKMALELLELALKNKEHTIGLVEKDEDWQGFLNDIDFRELLIKYS